VCKLLPVAMRAHLPAKDANACLDPKHYLGKALKNAVMFKAAVPKNSKLVYGSSLKEAAQQEAEYGLSYPWPQLTALTRGERKGEVCYWGAATKMGKSEILNALAAHSILEHGQKVFMAKPEEANAKTYKLLVGKAAGKIFHDPTVPFDHEAFEKYEPMIGDNVAMLDLYQHLTWDSVKQDILHAAGEGYTTVYLDPITNFTNQVSASEANEMLIAMAAEASSMAHDQQLSIHFFCHLLKPPSGSKPHERGGKVLSNQFSGSRAMMRSCNYMFGIEGNKDPELSEEERNMRQIVLLEDREFGQVGSVPLFWDKQTGLFTQV
jgi:twinkle protein